MHYAIEITPIARRHLQSLPKKQRGQVEHRIQRLADEPVPQDAKRLKGERFEGLFRVRSGDYRIVYQVRHEEPLVVIVKTGNRKDVYR